MIEKTLEDQRNILRERLASTSAGLSEIFSKPLLEEDLAFAEDCLSNWNGQPNLLEEMLHEVTSLLGAGRFYEASQLISDISFVSESGENECRETLAGLADRVEDRKNASSQYIEMGKLTRSIERKRSFFTRAAELNPENAQAYHELAWVYNEVREYDTGIQYSTEAIRLDAGNVEYYLERAYAFEQQERYESVVCDCSDALELAPASAPALRERGKAYHQMQKYELAIQDLGEAIRLEPNNATNWN
ncbi:MAG: tetratricopeptide repeat protein, partial [Planctomycetota bacterium]